MARGYSGQFGGKLNAPYVWLPLCVLFLLPFVDPRRPFRMLHLDLLALLAFGASHFFFNRGDISASVPLVYPVLVYLLARMLWAGFRRRESRARGARAGRGAGVRMGGVPLHRLRAPIELERLGRGDARGVGSHGALVRAGTRGAGRDGRRREARAGRPRSTPRPRPLAQPAV